MTTKAKNHEPQSCTLVMPGAPQQLEQCQPYTNQQCNGLDIIVNLHRRTRTNEYAGMQML